MKRIWKHRYQMIKELGKGGSGRVYLVRDLHLEKEWAMKELEHMPEQSQGEFWALKKLSHPRFPRIVDAFQEEDRRFLVMDYIQGVTLEEMIRKGKMEEMQVIEIGIQVTEALEYLHEFTPNLLYLDLKPANIMITENNEVKLVDVGSVIIKGNGGYISGTPGYAAPEQLQLYRQGQRLKEQADIFSFGIVLYAMAMGKLSGFPLPEAGRSGVCIRRENPMISPIMERIIEKCTRGTAAKRYACIRDVKSQLRELKRKKEKGSRLQLSPWERILRFFQRESWYQEKSILCTEGKAELFIARRMLVLLLMGIWIPALKLQAGEPELPKLEVILRDESYRKVLLKEGGIYECEGNLILEIPKEEIGAGRGQLEVVCRKEEGEQKYSLEWVMK